MTEHMSPASSPLGSVIDQLVSRILSEINRTSGLDLSRDPSAMARIQEAAEQAAREFETRDEVEINLPYITATSTGPVHYQQKFSRNNADMEDESFRETGVDRQQRSSPPTTLKLPDRKPVITIGLLVVMAGMYILQELTAFLLNQDWPAALGMKINSAIVAGQYWRLVTAMFLHGSILHLGFNLYALYILGRRGERFFGPWRFLGLFLLSGITGNLFSFLFTSSPSLGSSTAIFGLLAAEGVFIYQHRKLFGNRFKIALRQIVQVAVINFFIGLSPGIDNWGHFGGLLGGIAFSWFAGPAYKITGTPPLLELIDRSDRSRTAVVFIVQLLVLIGLTAWVIVSRS